MSKATGAERVAELAKEARLEERKLIEAGLDRRQKMAADHEKEMYKLRSGS